MPLNLDKSLIQGRAIKVQLSDANSSVKQNIDSLWFNGDSTIISFKVTHFSQADVFFEETISTQTATESKTTNFSAMCDNYEVVSTTVQPQVVNTSGYPLSYFESILGQSLTQQPPVTIAIQRKPELYPQYTLPPLLQLDYDIKYTRYFLGSQNDPGKYVGVPIQVIPVAKIVGTCHDQGIVN